jgi:diguanylate cyclase (GGDEF)-like protein
VVRLGGDEFAVLMANTTADEARRTAEAVRVALRSPYTVAGREVSLSASIGLLITGPDGKPPSFVEGLRAADLALYGAKDAGRDRVTEFGDLPSSRRYG